MAYLPLESNPEVMNLFMQKLGVSGKWNFVDVYGLDNESLSWVPRPVLAVILLFPCSDKYYEFTEQQLKELKEKSQDVSSHVYFMKQYVSNACGTIALIHCIANNTDQIELSEGIFKTILDMSLDMSPEERGEMLLKKRDEIMNAHKELALEGQSEVNPNLPVYHHFVAFVHKDGNLYELDGRKEFPINHGSTNPNTFLEDSARVCNEYIKREENDINFTVMALTTVEK